jgi:hypothetical protein
LSWKQHTLWSKRLFTYHILLVFYAWVKSNIQLQITISENTEKAYPSCFFFSESTLNKIFIELSPPAVKERLLALVRDLFTFSSKVIKMFILV